MKLKHLPLIIGFSLIASFLFADDYYWRGNQGEWSDVNNWRTSTGEIPEEIPDESDNVIFDGESFSNPYDTLFIYSQNPSCHNLTFINIPDTAVIYGGNSLVDFTIFGSFTCHGKVINDFQGNYVFMAQVPGKKIQTNGSRFETDIFFEGTGEWTLKDDLYVFNDMVDWDSLVSLVSDPDTTGDYLFEKNGPGIHLVRGTLLSDGHNIYTRGMRINGSYDRKLDIQNTEVEVVGSWNLTGQNLEFLADKSLITIGGPNSGMTNASGEEIVYYDINFLPIQNKIENIKIRTVHRKIHFFGAGALEGKIPPQSGSFTIDTLLFNGAVDPMTGFPISCMVVGPYHDIHYTNVGFPSYGEFEVRNGYFHRIDFEGAAFGIPATIKGRNNEIDTAYYFLNGGMLSGIQKVNNLVQFDSVGTIYAEIENQNLINHAVFRHDGFLGGTNFVDSLTLSTGHWYELMADSLMSTGENSNFFIQHVGFIEVEGDCNLGNTILTSSHKETRAVLNYYGGELEANYLMLKDLKNLNPSVPIVVNNGIDAGNNIGFDITNPDPRTFYWVGGGGRWSELEHFSLESGGPPAQTCVPNIFDNIIFDSNSGFNEEDSVVLIDVNHLWINDFIWEDVSNFDVLPAVAGAGEFTFHVWGDFILDRNMAWMYGGRVFFDSEDDQEWEQVHVDYTYPGFGPAHHLFNKTYFYGRGGKWEITYDSIYFMDTCYLWMGELLANKKHIDVRNFSAMDTLKKGLYLIDSTLVQVHQYMADGWSFNGYRMNEKTFFDAGWSTIRLLGDVSPPPGAPPGGCNMNTVGSGPDPVIYHNIEVGMPDGFTVEGEIRSFFYCKYNLVDYYVIAGNAVGAGEPSVIDTLTFKAGYDACRINDSYKINFLFAESKNDTIIGTHEIDSAYFYQRGSFLGWNWIDYLEAHQDMKMEEMNTINHAIYYGNSYNLGKNTYGKMQTFPDRIHTFSAPRPDEEHITIILNDWDVTGECDGPIRLQSDKPGFQADIYYEMINPSNDYTTRYSSIKDIRILGGKEYIAEESVDLSNNENWTWLESTDTLYYWIGGQGKWNNTQHWSRTSGGEPIDCVPKEIVHVIFDDNSFLTPSDTVFIDTTNALCKDMLWLQDSSLYKPVLIGDEDSKLFVYGSLYFGPGMQNNFLGLTYFDNINDTGPNYLHSNGTVFQNDIRMQGKGDHIILGDDLTMLVDTTVNPKIFRSIFLEHGGFETAGHTVSTAGFFSTFENERMINIEDSKVILKYEDHEGWWVYGENLDLYAENSTIYLTNFQTVMLTEKGGPDKLLQYHNVVLDSILCVVDNASCVAGYNEIYCNSMAGFISGNFQADTIYMNGSGCAMAEKSTTNVVYIDSTNCSVVGNHYINRCFVNVGKGKIEGSNHIEYCYFNAKGEFRGENVFDTLLLFAGNGVNGNGNIYIFESNKTQMVNDSLFMRGNPCANLTLKSSLPNIEGFIQKDVGYDVICDFLILQDLAVRSDNLEFYAGAFSSAIPDPNDPPSGWTMENADNYQFGFGNGKVEQFCKGETIILDAENFNAGPDAEYYWNGSDIPGDRFFTADSAGQYSLRVYYSPTCYQSDYINIETLETPEAYVDPGPYCEGEKIIAVVEPSDKNYNYDWFNGEQGSFIIAETNINSVYVTIENPINKCVTTTSQAVVVKPAPDPETFLGNDIIVKNKESFTLDAGEGDSYLWYSHPHLDIDPNDQRTITLTNNDEDFGDYEFYVLVTLGGCQKEGFINGELLPPNVIGVPTAFSPNGDGVNNVLELQGVKEGVIDLDFKVYDRYGKLVFESNDWNNNWDGTYNGKKLEMDVYTYYIKARFQDGAHFEDKGNITLLR